MASSSNSSSSDLDLNRQDEPSIDPDPAKEVERSNQKEKKGQKRKTEEAADSAEQHVLTCFEDAKASGRGIRIKEFMKRNFPENENTVTRPKEHKQSLKSFLIYQLKGTRKTIEEQVQNNKMKVLQIQSEAIQEEDSSNVNQHEEDSPFDSDLVLKGFEPTCSSKTNQDKCSSLYDVENAERLSEMESYELLRWREELMDEVEYFLNEFDPIDYKPPEIKTDKNFFTGPDLTFDDQIQQVEAHEPSNQIDESQYTACKWPNCRKKLKTNKNGEMLVLVEHSLTHSPINYYQCREEGCQMRMQTRSGVRTHYRNVHGNKKVVGYGLFDLPMEDPGFQEHYSMCFDGTPHCTKPKRHYI